MATTTTTTTNATNRRARRNKRVCLFGTSANPPTGNGGHRGIILSLARGASSSSSSTCIDDGVNDDFDEVRVLPVYRHMFQNKRGNQASFGDRVAMCKLAFGGIPKVIVSEAERTCFEKAADGLNDSEKASVKVGTADLLDMLIADEPDTDFSFALGADTFMDLTEWKWRRSHDVLSLLQGRLVVIYRAVDDGGDGVEDDGSSSKFCEIDLQERIGKVNREQFAKEEKGGPGIGEGSRGVDVDDNDNHDAEIPQRAMLMRNPSLSAVSSSLVRSTNDESTLRSLITPEVLDYIKVKGLYAFSPEERGV